MKPSRLHLPIAALSVALAIVTCASTGLSQSGSSGQVSYSSSLGPTEGGSEAYVFMTMFTAPTLKVKDINIPPFGTNDAVLKMKDSDLWGFGMGYNINDHLQINGDIAYGHVHYDAVWGTDELKGTGDMWDMRLGFDYYIGKRAIKPFIKGGIGYNAFDSGVPESLPQTVCWWDPWWGYVCDGYVDTHSSSEFTWYAGVGLRWDVAETLFVKASYDMMWMEVGDSGNTEFPEWRVSVGWSW